ncbi:hypothetical protein BC941DRAFT_75135 [Chlamydoabsidia padenii]|nr:hypothetical protein BC941DRAFT_75135 [Chlamydoabsidia padenii]
MTTGQTYRQKLLQTIEIIFMFLRLLDGKDAQSRKDLDDSAVAYAIIASSRYLSRRTWGAVRSVIPSYPNLFLENKKHHLKQKIRMTWDGFQKMIDAFKDHEVFDHATQGYPAQLQFLVAFHHFGCDGNGASVGLIADYFGISGGSADNFTWSVVKAILAKEREYVYWPRWDAGRAGQPPISFR